MSKINTNENVISMLVSENLLLVTEMVFNIQFVDLSTFCVTTTFRVEHTIEANGFLYDKKSKSYLIATNTGTLIAE
jgi:hypothetical protein